MGDGLWNQVEPHRLCDDVGAIFGAELALSFLEVRTDRLVSDAQQASGFCNLAAIRDQAQDRQLTGCERCCLAYSTNMWLDELLQADGGGWRRTWRP